MALIWPLNNWCAKIIYFAPSINQIRFSILVYSVAFTRYSYAHVWKLKKYFVKTHVHKNEIAPSEMISIHCAREALRLCNKHSIIIFKNLERKVHPSGLLSTWHTILDKCILRGQNWKWIWERFGDKGWNRRKS